MRRSTVVLAWLLAATLAACGGSTGGPEAHPSTLESSVSPGSGGVAGPAPDASCARESSLASISGDEPTTVEFVNQTQIPVQTLWLDYHGERVFYRRVAAGGSYQQATFITHPWVIADLDGTCLLLVVTDANLHRVQIGP